jgi:hypothetical protein
MEEKEQREREEKEADEKRAKKALVKDEKLTGKQLWERGLAGKADYDEDDEDAIPAAVEKMKITA